MLASIHPPIAQSYFPFPDGEAYLYSYTPMGSADTWFLAAAFDSVRTEASDTAYYFYRIDRRPVPSDTQITCLGSAILQSSSAILPDQDHYLGRKMIAKSNGECRFVTSHGDTFNLQTMAAIGNTWSWSNGVTATVDSIVQGMVLAVPDSLKYIRLSSGQSWILSKSHGLVKCTNLLPYPGTTPDVEFEIWGIPTMGLGDHFPDYGDIFQFDPGDQFGHQATHYSHPEWNIELSNAHVVTLEAGTRFEYQMLVDPAYIHHVMGGPYDTTHAPASTQFVIFDSLSYLHLNLFPFQHIPRAPGSFPALVHKGIHRASNIHDRLQVDFDRFIDFDTCAQAYLFDNGYGYQQFVVGIGAIYDHLNYILSSESRTLLCYKKGNETWGTCPVLEPTTGMAPAMNGQVELSPNPASAKVTLHFTGDLTGEAKTIFLLGMDGRKVGRVEMPAGQGTMEWTLESIPSGIYQLQIECNEQLIQRRLVVLH